ncbi:MAG: hypothetical protein DSY89_00030 [Deltaproteobacteria bacterium]|nr:MAG: hypothetical protein DSY89_00030 [Deltaproteobacteria bacterium]
MKKCTIIGLVMAMAVFMVSGPAFSGEEVGKGGVRGVRERLDALENIMKGIGFSGVIELEGGYSDVDYDDPETEDEKSSDLSVANVEFAIDAGITDRVKGHILFKYEDDEDVTVDEAIIHFQADGVCVPNEACHSMWYASAGKLYVPFGYFQSHFISDPLTLELGETRETAVVAGIHFSGLNLAAGVYNGDMDETDADNQIEDYVASITYTLPEGTVNGFGFMAGVSFVSDIADSDGLTDFINDTGTDTVDNYVDGYSAFFSISIIDKVAIELEYLAAVDDYADTPALGADFEPAAWNVEVAYVPMDALEIALRYAGSNDTLNMLPETQYGATAAYGIFENTSLAIEYLHDQFENDDEADIVTVQLAIEY